MKLEIAVLINDKGMRRSCITRFSDLNANHNPGISAGLTAEALARESAWLVYSLVVGTGDTVFTKRISSFIPVSEMKVSLK
jgi:hypothetical protein